MWLTVGCAGCRATESVGQPAGVLEDYADVAEGLLVLAQVTASRDLLVSAGALLDACLDISPTGPAVSSILRTMPKRWCDGRKI